MGKLRHSWRNLVPSWMVRALVFILKPLRQTLNINTLFTASWCQGFPRSHPGRFPGSTHGAKACARPSGDGRRIVLFRGSGRGTWVTRGVPMPGQLAPLGNTAPRAPRPFCSPTRGAGRSMTSWGDPARPPWHSLLTRPPAAQRVTSASQTKSQPGGGTSSHGELGEFVPAPAQAGKGAGKSITPQKCCFLQLNQNCQILSQTLSVPGPRSEPSLSSGRGVQE